MKNPTYLSLSRHNIYYFRWSIPCSLHPTHRTTDIKLSLLTREPQQALQIGRVLAYLAETAIRNPAIKAMKYHQIRDVLSEAFQEYRDKAIQRINDNGPLNALDVSAYSSSHTIAGHIAETGELFLEGQDMGMSALITAQSLPLKTTDAAFPMFQQEFMKAYRDYCRSVLDYNASLDSFDFSSAQHSAAKHHRTFKKISIREAIDEYVAFKIQTKGWREQSAIGFKAQLDILAEYVGVDGGIDISTEGAIAIQRMLFSIPRFSRSQKKLSALSLQELMVLKHNDPMTPNTVAKYFETYIAFYDWLLSRKYVSENPFKPLRTKVDNEDTKDAFTPTQIKAIVSYLTGQKPAPFPSIKEHHKWGGMIAIYSGARLNEVAQLEINDVFEEEGVWGFNLTDLGDDGEASKKRLKNTSSKRKVPIHTKLIQAGFLEFYQAQKQKGSTRLFPEFPYCPKNGWGRNLGRWYNEAFLPKVNLKTKRLTFHSFRHSMIEQLYQIDDCKELAIKAIVGHAKAGTTERIYARNAFTLAGLKQALDKVHADT